MVKVAGNYCTMVSAPIGMLQKSFWELRVPEQAAKPIRPLYFVASYPRSSGRLVSSMIYLMIELSRSNGAKTIDLSDIDKHVPWDAEGILYTAVSGREFETLSETEVAGLRPKVHELIATGNFSLPVVRTHAMRGEFYGHETINSKVSVGGIYVVRNPLDIAAAYADDLKLPVMRIVEAMMTLDRRIQPMPNAVVEPQGSWSQNSASWTASGQPEILVQRYEDIRARYATSLKAIAAHMRLPINNKQIDAAHTILTEVAKKDGHVGKRDFRDFLIASEARAVVEAHAVEMDRHGYLTDDVLKYVGLNKEQALTKGLKHVVYVN